MCVYSVKFDEFLQTEHAHIISPVNKKQIVVHIPRKPLMLSSCHYPLPHQG